MGVTAVRLLSSLGLLVIIVQAQNCPKPVGGPNMYIKGNDILLTEFPEGKTVTFACNIGYVSKGGTSSTTCTNGSWSPVLLICERKNCGAAEEVAFGHVEYQPGTEFGDKAVAICNTGYMPVGKGTLTCGVQGWEGRLPVCEVIKCESPPVVVDGSYYPNKITYDYSEVVQYSCKKEYTLDGANHLTCSDDGTFKPNPPRCIMVKCEEPEILNGFRTGRGPPYGHKSTVNLECNTGYIMSGNAMLTCDINSQWVPELPKCTAQPIPTTPTTPTKSTTTTTTTPRISTVVDNCEDPKKNSPEVTVSRGPPYKPSDQVTVSCPSGAKQVRQTVTCQENGLWDLEIPKCETEGNGSGAPTSKTVIILVVVLCVGVVVVIIILVFIKKRKGTRRGNTHREATKEGEDVALS